MRKILYQATIEVEVTESEWGRMNDDEMDAAVEAIEARVEAMEIVATIEAALERVKVKGQVVFRD